MASKPGNTQTLVISVRKTGLAGSVVLARFLCTSIVLSTSVLLLMKAITDTVWLLIAFQFADTLIDEVNGSYHVILQPVTKD